MFENIRKFIIFYLRKDDDLNFKLCKFNCKNSDKIINFEEKEIIKFLVGDSIDYTKLIEYFERTKGTYIDYIL